MPTTNTTNTTAIQPMTKKTLHRHMAALAMACAAVALSGCAALSPSTPEQVVQKRATDYWKARVAGQVDKAYALSTPSYRKLRTPAQFKMQFGVGANVEAAEVTKVNCEAEKCTVQVKLDVKPALLGLKIGTISTYFDEAWLLEDGQWWHYQDL